MLISLLTTAFLMGLAGVPHCAAMCATPCAVALPQGLPVSAVLGRSLGYAVLGALAAAATATLASWSRWFSVLQPFWIMALAAAVLLGGWMLIRGALPMALQNHGLAAYRRLQGWLGGRGWLNRHPQLAAVLPTVLGMAWAALPCGLLYGAVMVAALAPELWGGAAVMLAFSLPGAVALWWLPRRLSVWRWAQGGDSGAPASSINGPSDVQAQAVVPVLWLKTEAVAASAGGTGSPVAGSQPPWWVRLADPQWAIRLSGACLVAGAGWALMHRLTVQWQAWCA